MKLRREGMGYQSLNFSDTAEQIDLKLKSLGEG